ncbi:MAG: hypothetical protein R6U62_09475 [Bacteroidales bacterium]
MKTSPVLILFLVLLLPFTGCDEDESRPAEAFPEIVQGEGVFIINEGNFGWNNASLGYYDKTGDTMHPDLFMQTHGEALGDVFQSMMIHNDKAYMVVNNSGRIEVLHPETLERIGTIEGLTSPRYFVPVNDNKAYVTDLYAGRIHILDLQTLEVTGHISVHGWTEAIAELSSRIVATGVESDQLYVIDPETDQLTDSIHVPPGPVSVTTTADGDLWVLSGGESWFKTPPVLYQINGHDLSIRAEHPLPDADNHYSRLTVCPEGKTLYFLGGDVYRLHTDDSKAEVDVIIPAEGRLFYGLSVDPSNGELYVSDAIDYVQQGRMLRYDSEGNLLHSQHTGNIPGDFIFY